jgi:hypothetical protein
MAWKPSYCTSVELKAYARIPDADVVDDVQVVLAAEAASRAVDHYTNRQFGLTGSAVARVYTWAGGCIDGRRALPIDDVQTTASLAVALDFDGDGTFEETVVYQTDFDFWPYNAAADGKPWTHLVTRPGVLLPCSARGIRVTANFGWSVIPDAVKQATLLQANRLLARRSAAFGVTGSPEMGGELRLLAAIDPDVAVALRPYRRWWGAR